LVPVHDYPRGPAATPVSISHYLALENEIGQCRCRPLYVAVLVLLGADSEQVSVDVCIACAVTVFCPSIPDASGIGSLKTIEEWERITAAACRSASGVTVVDIDVYRGIQVGSYLDPEDRMVRKHYTLSPVIQGSDTVAISKTNVAEIWLTVIVAVDAIA
jgi:hypothetical protein